MNSHARINQWSKELTTLEGGADYTDPDLSRAVTAAIARRGIWRVQTRPKCESVLTLTPLFFSCLANPDDVFTARLLSFFPILLLVFFPLLVHPKSRLKKTHFSSFPPPPKKNGRLLKLDFLSIQHALKVVSNLEKFQPEFHGVVGNSRAADSGKCVRVTGPSVF